MKLYLYLHTIKMLDFGLPKYRENCRLISCRLIVRNNWRAETNRAACNTCLNLTLVIHKNYDLPVQIVWVVIEMATFCVVLQLAIYSRNSSFQTNIQRFFRNATFRFLLNLDFTKTCHFFPVQNVREMIRLMSFFSSWREWRFFPPD